MKDKYIGPIFGPESFQVVKTSIEETGLRMPSFSEMVLIIHNAFQNINKDYYKKLIKLLEENPFWTNTRVLYTPRGVIIQDAPTNELDQQEKSEKCVKYGSYKVDHLKTSQLTSNKFLLTLTNKDSMSSLESIAKEYDSRFKDFQDSTYLFSLDELPDVFEGEPQTRLVGVGIWETDLGTPAGFHINALIDESEDELEIREAKRGGHVYRKGFRGRYGIGIR